MFELGLTGGPRRSIAVETRNGTALENYIPPTVSQQDINAYHGVMRPHHPQWRWRKDAVGGYNCAGMVWASRRTALTNPSEWQLILQEDGYRRLAAESEAEIGDVVVYRSRHGGEILHVARLCMKDSLSAGTAVVLWALSKWDQRTGEDIHRLFDVPHLGDSEFDIEIWTDRPGEVDPRIAQVSRLPRIST